MRSGPHSRPTEESRGIRTATLVSTLLTLAAGCATTPEPWGTHELSDDVRPAPSRAPSRSTTPTTEAWNAAPLEPRLDREKGDEKSYVIPAVEIVGYIFLLNQFDRHLVDEDTYGTDWESIKENLQSGWVIDKDPFAVNQLGHPYSGAMYLGFARSTGHDFWTSMGYAFAGSALWEVAGETSKPSLNDQISTPFGGSFLGEALFRTSSWIFDRSEMPRLARRLSAAAVSPATAFNRFVYEDRFRHPDYDPAVFLRGGIGVQQDTNFSENDQDLDEQTDAVAEFAVDYGIPGKRGYDYERPFDYFHLDAAAISKSDNIADHVIVHGLLVGEEYDAGDDWRGVWGLYGGYDYISPGLFRVASTALSVGTTLQRRFAEASALQSTSLLGVGFGPAGTVSDDQEDRDYHYGAIPQAQMGLRLVLGERMMLEVGGRDYYVTGEAYNDNSGSENIAQAEASLLLRIHESHALRLRYVASWRDSTYSNDPDKEQEVGSVMLTYTLLGGSSFGGIE
jgi:hypothetical protein